MNAQVHPPTDLHNVSQHFEAGILNNLNSVQNTSKEKSHSEFHSHETVSPIT